MTYTASGDIAKKPGPGLVLSLIVLIVGIVAAAVGAVTGVTSVFHDIRGIAVNVAPRELHQQLDSGTWEIYAPRDTDGFTPTDVTVTGPSGASIPTRGVGSTTETITKGGQTYQGDVKFTIVQGGFYDVKVTGTGATPFLLSKSLGDIVKHALAWFAVAVVGFLIAVIGIVLLITGIVRRRRADRPAMASGGYQGGYPVGAQQWPAQPAAPVAQPAAATPTTPAGWYPDPSIPGTNRYWDGTQWTDQTHTP